MHKTILTSLLLGTIFLSSAAQAASWTVNSESSSVSFGSVKNTTVGEVHTFSDVSGKVDEKGVANVKVALKSLETNIDIRNERMHKHLFNTDQIPEASYNTTLDMKQFQSLQVGEVLAYDMEGTMQIGVQSVEMDIPVTVTRLGDNQVLVSSDGLVMLDADDFDLKAGIEKLRKIAKLNSIDLAVPLTFRLIFNKNP
ncbi:MAG: YceI family protein [Sneathiellales bacterium]|nr:YceI family protein [Sneathiellales bacterium]